MTDSNYKCSLACQYVVQAKKKLVHQIAYSSIQPWPIPCNLRFLYLLQRLEQSIL